MATHCSILAWKIPWTEEPGGPQSIRVARGGHNLVTKPPPPLFKKTNTCLHHIGQQLINYNCKLNLAQSLFLEKKSLLKHSHAYSFIH